MIIIFDLDDTLYEELTYVRSGISAVAAFLEPYLNISKDQINTELNLLLLSQRHHLFDRYLLEKGMSNKKMIQNCIRIYRNHSPSITLFSSAEACLMRLAKYPLYLVTDGNHLVQRKKATALGLDKYFRKCFYTYAYGHHRMKPSTYCFEKICQIEKTNPNSVFYIADNPHKDFVGIKTLGFQTIQVLSGPYQNDQVDERHQPHMKIASLDHLDVHFFENWNKVKL